MGSGYWPRVHLRYDGPLLFLHQLLKVSVDRQSIDKPASTLGARELHNNAVKQSKLNRFVSCRPGERRVAYINPAAATRRQTLV